MLPPLNLLFIQSNESVYLGLWPNALFRGIHVAKEAYTRNLTEMEIPCTGLLYR